MYMFIVHVPCIGVLFPVTCTSLVIEQKVVCLFQNEQGFTPHLQYADCIFVFINMQCFIACVIQVHVYVHNA